MRKFLCVSSTVLGAFVFLALCGGCARNMSSSTYDARTVTTTGETYPCTVVSVRKVRIEEGDYLEDNKTGALMGAVAGGVLGNMVGSGRGRTLTTAGGALAGGVGGAMAEKALKSQDGLEYVVRLKNGGMRTVVQGMDNALYNGQSALLIIGGNGRSRLIPAAN